MKVKIIYDASSAFSQEEDDFFQKVIFPTEVSCTVVSDGGIEGKVLLDAGAGPGTRFGKWVEESGGRYVGLDIHHQSLQKLQARNLCAGGGDICSMPMKDRAVDISHERFVLMHLPQERRRRAIVEMIRVARERAIFIEYDWGTFKGCKLVNGLRDLVLSVFPKHTDPYIGHDFGHMMRGVLTEEGVSARRVVESVPKPRGPGMYWDELILLSKMFYGTIKRLHSPHAAEAGRMAGAIMDHAQKPGALPFTPPAIVAVTVEM